MEHEEFVGRVRVQLGAKSEEEAVRTVEAYLETLAERLGGFGPYELSEKLPWLEAYPAGVQERRTSSRGKSSADAWARGQTYRRRRPCGERGWWARCSRGRLVGTPWTTSVGSCPSSSQNCSGKA
jgi:uncharacterized protein (DUF2267 family)